jgi:hypothetical protein
MGLASVIDGADGAGARGDPATSDMQGVSLVEALVARCEPARVRVRAAACSPAGSRSRSHCPSFTEPWRASSELLVRSWYGAEAPADPQPRMVLHERERDRGIGHASSAALTESVVAPLRAAALAWEERVVDLRRRHQPGDEAKSP